MMRSRWGRALVGLLVVGLWTAPAAAQSAGGPGSGPGMQGYGARGGGFMLPLLIKGVGLTDAQQAQVRQIVSAHRPQFQALRGQLQAVQDQLAQKLYTPGTLAATDLDPLRQQIGQLREQLTQEGLQVALEVRGVLTAEQLAKAGQTWQRLSELRSEMRSLVGGGQQ